MKIDISSLIGGLQNRIDFGFELPCDEAPYGVTFPKAAQVKGTVTDMAGFIQMKINADIGYETECARCLKPLSGIFSTEFIRTVAMPGTVQDETSDDYVTVENNAVDVDIPLLEQILLEFPTKFLCKEECKGLCPKCGKDLNDGPCSCVTKEIDPRLAKLAEYKDE